MIAPLGFYSVQGHSLPGWRYMFIMIACFSFLVSGFVGWYLPDSPTKAKWSVSKLDFDTKLTADRWALQLLGRRQSTFD